MGRKQSRLKHKAKRTNKATHAQKRAAFEASAKQVEPLTTKNMIRKKLTNPKANIALSGKKKKLLIKQIKSQKKAEAKKKAPKEVDMGETKDVVVEKKSAAAVVTD